MFAQAGIGTTELTEIVVTILDEHYLVARTEWAARRDKAEPIRLVSSYVLHRDGEAMRVVAYLNHQGPST